MAMSLSALLCFVHETLDVAPGLTALFISYQRPEGSSSTLGPLTGSLIWHVESKKYQYPLSLFMHYPCLLWVSNYLHDRYQCTLANGKLSSMLPVTYGVPQGSILGPLFFISYINDVRHFIDDAEVGLYADDTVIHTHNSSWLSALNSLPCFVHETPDVAPGLTSLSGFQRQLATMQNTLKKWCPLCDNYFLPVPETLS